MKVHCATLERRQTAVASGWEIGELTVGNRVAKKIMISFVLHECV